MSQSWYVECDGRVEGPFTSRELRERAAAGSLRSTDKVSPDGRKWALATKIKGLTFADPIVPRDGTTLVTGQAHSGSAPTADEQIPGYEVLGVLGKGACGVVFRAKQLKLDRVVALKMVLSDRAPTESMLARFDKEAVSLAKLKHPNIVSVYDCGHHNGQAYFAMELLEGEDLGARIDRAGPLDEFTAWHIARQTASALAHAADLGVYHRDIKPANLFLTAPPTGYPLPPGVPLVKVTDFGLAITRQTGDERTDQRLTAAGVVLGTPAYMPPEQFAGSNIDHRADIYALGASVFHMLSGDLPFKGGSIWEVMLKKSEPVPRLIPPVSAESANLVARLMARDPGDRVATYHELVERIGALSFMRDAGGAPPPRAPRAAPETEQPAPRARTRTKVYALALVGVVAAAGVAALALSGSGRPKAGAALAFVTGDRVELFDRRNVLAWQGQGWSIAPDGEGTSILTGDGKVRRSFDPPANFRVVLGLDPFDATNVEVVVATADGSTKQWSVNVDRAAGASFGVRESEAAPFRPLGPAIPVPPKDADKLQYGEVRFERAGGRVRAFYLGRPLGEIEDRDLARTGAVTIVANGTVRIDTAAVEELIAKP